LVARVATKLSTSGGMGAPQLACLVTELVEILMWRLIWWGVRILWLPIFVVAFVYYVALPALGTIAEALLTPGGLLVGFLLLVWMRPSRRRRSREERRGG
jgi:hypothetical protein